MNQGTLILFILLFSTKLKDHFYIDKINKNYDIPITKNGLMKAFIFVIPLFILSMIFLFIIIFSVAILKGIIEQYKPYFVLAFILLIIYSWFYQIRIDWRKYTCSID